MYASFIRVYGDICFAFLKPMHILFFPQVEAVGDMASRAFSDLTLKILSVIEETEKNKTQEDKVHLLLSFFFSSSTCL